MTHRDDVLIGVGDKIIRFNLSPEDHALFISMGATLACIQSFEHEIAMYLAAMVQFEDGRCYDDRFDFFLQNTLGRASNILIKHIAEQEISDQLFDAVARRNYFVHKLLHQKWPFFRYEECIELVEYMTDLTDFLRELSDRLLIYFRDEKNMQIIGVRIDPVSGEPVEI